MTTYKPDPSQPISNLVPPYLRPTALYRMYGSEDVLLYVGITCRNARFGQHKRKSAWWPEVVTITLEWYPTRGEAQQAEIAAIRTETPKYNRRFVLSARQKARINTQESV